MKKYSSHKDSGIAWIGQIPSHWNTNKIGAHFTERKEKVSDKDYAPLSVTKLGILPQLEDAAKTENGDNRKLVLKGDFVVNSRSDRKSSCGVSTYDGSVSLINIILKPRNINQDYIHYLFRSNDYVEEFYRNGRGIVADLWTTRYSEMKNIFIPIPPVDEQEAIVRYITEKSEKIDRYIAEQERLLAALDELRQAEIARAVTRGLNPDAPLRDSGIDWIGSIPAHWEIEPMGRHFEFSKGLTITKANLTPAGVAVISYGQIHNRANTGVTISQDLVRYVPVSYLETNPECLLRPNDFIFADTSEDIEGSGNCAFNDYADEIFAGYHTVIARPLDLEYPKYTAYLFQSKPWKEQVHQNVNAVKVYSINRTILKKTTILIPPLDEQRAIVGYLDAKTAKIDRMKADIEKQIGLLKEYKQRMIFDAVTGKIDVREALSQRSEL